MRRILVTNVYADDNRGGAALTSAAVLLARHLAPAADISLLTLVDDPALLPCTHRYSARDHPDVEILPRLLPVSGRWGTGVAVLASIALLALPRPVLRRVPQTSVVRNADLVIGKGGHMFRARGIRGVAALWLATYPLLLASRLGCPTVLYGQNFGPFTSLSARLVSGWLIKRLDLVLLRDAASLARARDAGVTGPRVVAVPDTVLSLEAPGAEETRQVLRRLGLTGRRYCVLTLSVKMLHTPSSDRTLQGLASLVERLLDQDVDEEVLVVLHADGETASDRALSEQFVQGIGCRRVRLFDAPCSWRELAAVYAQARFTVGGRLHSAVLSLLVGTPAFPLEVDAAKASDVFGELGLGERVVHLDEEEVEAVLARILAAVDEGESGRIRSRQICDAARARLDVVERQLAAWLTQPPSPARGRHWGRR